MEILCAKLPVYGAGQNLFERGFRAVDCDAQFLARDIERGVEVEDVAEGAQEESAAQGALVDFIACASPGERCFRLFIGDQLDSVNETDVGRSATPRSRPPA